LTQVSDELIQLRGLRFHYREWPSATPNVQVLVLLHGYTGHARSWDEFAAAMSTRFRVLALDQRGHGETQWAPATAYGTTEMVQDTQAFVQAMGLKDFLLLGLSMGGIVAIGYSGLAPPELERLVIVDIAPEIAASGLQRIQQNVARSDVFDSREAAFERARKDNPIPPQAHQRKRVYESLMRTDDGSWTYRYDPALRDTSNPRERTSAADGWKLVENINVPTLLLRGELSNILDRDVAEKMVDTLQDGKLVEIEGSGHPVPLDKPDEFLQAVDAWL
jgi:pimeloyl-ACP methyl ester carboxylesterase